MSKIKDMSRRTFLKGAGAVAASSLLPHFPNIVRADNHEINLVGWGGEFRESQYKAAEEATGIKIIQEGLPTGSWSDVMQKYTLWGQTGYSHADIMFLDDLLGGMYGINGWALDLSDLNAYTDNADDLTDSVNVLDNAMGGVFRIFYFMGATPFFYNTDLVPEHPANLGRLRQRRISRHGPGSRRLGLASTGRRGARLQYRAVGAAPYGRRSAGAR